MTQYKAESQRWAQKTQGTAPPGPPGIQAVGVPKHTQRPMLPTGEPGLGTEAPGEMRKAPVSRGPNLWRRYVCSVSARDVMRSSECLISL